VHLVHGSPRKVNEYLFEEKPPRLFERLAKDETADVIVFGHTHKPWVGDCGDVSFVNCGSVGKPKDGDPRAAFAILRSDGGGVAQVTIERVEYDAQAVAREVAAVGLPRALPTSSSRPAKGRRRCRDVAVPSAATPIVRAFTSAKQASAVSARY